MIKISPTALQEIRRIQLNQKVSTDSSLQLGVKAGGCSGLFYNLELVSQEKASNSKNRRLEIDGVTVTIDENSWKYIENLQLDYSEDLMGGGFRFHNPQAQDICGCGISFAYSKQAQT